MALAAGEQAGGAPTEDLVPAALAGAALGRWGSASCTVACGLES